MPELHVRPAGFQKIREIANLKHLFINELDKSCFAHEVAYSDSKNVAKRTISENVLKDRTYEIEKNPKYNGYKTGLLSMV